MVFFVLNKINLSKACFNCTYNIIVRMVFRKIGVLILVALLAACSTRKNTWLSRSYNNTTARYNIYYNGLESFKEGEKSLMVNHTDNYTDVLSLFPYSGQEKAGAVRSEMDRAISKGHKLIKEKSIKVKPKRKPSRNQEQYAAFYNQREFNRWVDDAYLLIGKAHLYNHDFGEALLYFDFIMREFAGHRVRFDAMIWMIRTRIEMGDFDNARLLLNQYDGMGQAPARLYGEYMATYADYLIRRKQYEEAISYMITAAEMAQGKWHKSRRNYILAQLYQASGQYQAAHDRYLKVVRSNPEYEMNLNARLNLAILEGQMGGNISAARKELNKLVQQSKNAEFRDRIYYILAQSYLNEADTVPTLTNLRLSAGYNSSNQELKTETFVTLAGLYFDKDMYIPSFAYYDSTLMVMKEDDERMSDVRERHAGLSDLAKHYTVIQTEDSVRRIAAMPVAERDAFIDHILEQQQLAMTQPGDGRQMEGAMANDPFFYRNFSSQLTRQTDSQGQWYFYNPTTVSLGKMDFEKRWGRRPSEDNWRRSDKGTAVAEEPMTPPEFPGEGQTLPVSGEESSETQESMASAPAMATKESLLEGLPLTEEMMAASDDRLAKAYFHSGMVFFDQFDDYGKAAHMFQKVVDEYPNHELAEQAWFWAFRSYALLGDANGMDRMKQGLLTYFPNSRYTAFVTDPEFAARQEQKNKALNQTYEQAYAAYLRSNYATVLSQTQTVLTTSETEELLRKSHLLRAVTYGKLGNNPQFIMELQTLVDDYGDSSEGRLATKWLAMLDEGRQPVPGPVMVKSIEQQRDTLAEEASIETTPAFFEHQPEAQQYLILVVNSEADVNRLFFNLADYNFGRFLLADYDIESKQLPDGQRILTVGRFGNQREVMDYFFGVRENNSIFQVDNIGTPSIFAGSESNLTQLVSSGDLTGFRQFFTEKYLSGSTGTRIIPGSVPEPSSQGPSSLEDPSQKEPEAEAEPLSYQREEGLHWGMVLLTGRVDKNRVTTFLENHALNNLRMKVTVRAEVLSSGEEVLLVEAFKDDEAIRRFFESLAGNYFWNNQLGARNWSIVSITPANYEVLKQEGSSTGYLGFYKENYK